MFKKTRKQLTYFYAGIIGLILVIMAVSFYLVLSTVILKNESDRISKTAQNALQEWTKRTQKHVEDHDSLDGHKMEWEYIQSDQFALIVGEGGQIISHSLNNQNIGLLQTLPGFLKNWTHNSENVEVVKNGETVIYSIFKYPINNTTPNKLYIGLNVSNDMKLLVQMKILLSILSFVLLIIASLIGYILADRAIIPLKYAFKKQQEFTANASHELRTPLSVLQASIEIIEEEKKRLPTLHQSILGSMKDEIHRMIQLAEHLLTLARNESKSLKSQFEAVDLQSVIKSAAEKLQLIADERKIKLMVLDNDLKKDELLIGDPIQIYQLMYILLDNAIKYSFEKGLVTIQCKYLIKPNRYEIIISDQGLGIPKEDLPQIFERFYRVDKARSRDSGGTGLGLSIAASIVQLHGGKITVDSTLDEGSIFHIILPRILKK